MDVYLESNNHVKGHFFLSIFVPWTSTYDVWYQGPGRKALEIAATPIPLHPHCVNFPAPSLLVQKITLFLPSQKICP